MEKTLVTQRELTILYACLTPRARILVDQAWSGIELKEQPILLVKFVVVAVELVEDPFYDSSGIKYYNIYEEEIDA